jgi:hypothetical protein
MVQFDWRLNERGARVSGRGVARAEPPYRARLDLFDGSNETVARAGLRDGQLCLPPEAPEDIIPPSTLLWAALGVFRPGPTATLLGAGRSGEQVELRYSAAGGRELRYYVEGERVREVELVEDGRVLHRVTVSPSATAVYPVDATYRNLSAFRELEMVTRSVEHVESFASKTWLPPC